MGSVDRHARTGDPDTPGRGDGVPDRPDPSGPPDPRDRARETRAEFEERLGLSSLTRAGAYESLRAKADILDAPFRDGLARERSGSRESLSDPDRTRGPADPPRIPADHREHEPESTRGYWTEVPRFLALWGEHVRQWPGRPLPKADQPITADQRAAAADSVRGIREAEPAISRNVESVAADNAHQGWLEGFEFRLKGEGRLMEKVAESLETSSPDASVHEVIRELPDAIRYTFCPRSDDYSAGFLNIKESLESCGYVLAQIKNSWINPEYKGINTRWVAPAGQRFEVQFHTEESFHAKHHVTHEAYERLRNPLTSSSERAELSAFQRDVSSLIRIPRDVSQIPDYKKEGA